MKNISLLLGVAILSVTNAKSQTGMTTDGAAGQKFSRLNTTGHNNQEKAIGVYHSNIAPRSFFEVNTNPTHFTTPILNSILVNGGVSEVFRTDAPIDSYWRMFSAGTEIGNIFSLSSGGHFGFNAIAGNMLFQTSGFERMRIHQSVQNGFIGVGNSAAFVALSQMHINTLGTSAANPATLGEVFRTEGDNTIDNNWRFMTGATIGATTQKGRFFTSNIIGSNKVPLVHALRENFNIEATQADMVFWANGTRPLGTIPIERMRISSEQFVEPGGAISNNITRVGISRDNSFVVTEPRAMLHVGDGWGSPGAGGHRAWNDVGTYYNKLTDMMYVGLDNVAADVTNAVIGWGDNPVNAFGVTGIGDRMIFRFLAATGSGTASGANGLEMLRMVSDGNNGRIGIGDFPNSTGLIDPGNTLEIISSANSPQQAGLRFRNLTSSATPVANPGNGVLSVDTNGDVIYVNQGQALGNICGSITPNSLTNNWEIPLNNFNFIFSGQGSVNNNVGVGTTCAPVAKLEILQSSTNSASTGLLVNNTDVEGIAGDFIANGPYAVKGLALQQSSTLFTTTGVYGEAKYNSTKANYGVEGYSSLSSSQNYGGRFQARSSVNAPVSNFGVEGTGLEADNNYGGFFVAGSFLNPSSNNTGIYATALGLGALKAGVFDGDVDVIGVGTITAGSWSPSDKQFKKEVAEMNSSLQFINKLKPKSYLYDVDNKYKIKFYDKKQYGFIAQELEEVIPELVKETTIPARYDHEGNIIAEKVTFKTVNYDGLIAFLVGGMQEQQKQIEELKAIVENNLSQSQANNSINVELNDAKSIVLNQNVPNPFAEQTTITYTLTSGVQKAQMLFYNANGILINSVDLNLVEGKGQLNVFANDLSNGIYTYTLVVDGQVMDTKRMVKNK